MDAVKKLIAGLGAPIALIYAIGILAQVINLWCVEKAHHFGYLEAWHIVSLLDREYVIGLGIKYLSISLVVALFLATIAIFFLRKIIPFLCKIIPFLRKRSECAAARSSKLAKELEIRAFTPFKEPAVMGEQKPSKPSFVKYQWLLLSSFFLALLSVFIWLPLNANVIHPFFQREPDSVIEYLPRVEISITNTSDNDSPDTEGAGQTVQAQASNEVTGVLLSHDSEYWYVLSFEEDEENARISVITLEEANNVQIAP